MLTGPAQRPQHDQGARKDEAGAGEARGGSDDGREDQRLRLPRVLGQEQGGRQGGLRDGHQGRAPGQSVLTLDTLTHSKLGDSFTSQTCQVIGQLSVS